MSNCINPKYETISKFQIRMFQTGNMDYRDKDMNREERGQEELEKSI
jgi:hypothetical protein